MTRAILSEPSIPRGPANVTRYAPAEPGTPARRGTLNIRALAAPLDTAMSCEPEGALAETRIVTWYTPAKPEAPARRESFRTRTDYSTGTFNPRALASPLDTARSCEPDGALAGTRIITWYTPTKPGASPA